MLMLTRTAFEALIQATVSKLTLTVFVARVVRMVGNPFPTSP